MWIKLLLSFAHRFRPLRVIKALLCCTVFLSGLCFALDEDTWVYYQLLFSNTVKSTFEPHTKTWLSPDMTIGGSSGAGNSGSGSVGTTTAGVNLMYINSIADEYIKDWLSIARDHASWEYMQIEKPSFEIPITSIIGGAVCESGSNNGVPYASVSWKNYKKDPNGLTSLYTFNTAVYNQLGSEYRGYPIVEGGYRTQFQLTRTWAAISPASGESYGRGDYLPSKLNGYGITPGKVRDNTGTDMAFFPDQVAMYLQSTVGRVKSAVDPDTIQSNAVSPTIYAIHNGGPGITLNTWSVGGRAGTDYTWTSSNSKFGVDAKWNSSNTMTKEEIASSVLNKIGNIIEKASLDLMAGVTSVNDAPPSSPYYYEGVCLIYMLNQPNCFTTYENDNMSRIESRLKGECLEGAQRAYKAIFGKDVSKAEIVSWVKSKIGTVDIDTSFYGPLYHGKNKYLEWVIYWLDNDISVYNSSGAGPKPALHALNAESLRGAFCAQISGNVTYWRMLVAGGVDVTYEQAFSDGGSLVDSIGNTYWEGKPLYGFTADNRLIRPNSPMCCRTPPMADASTNHAGEDYGGNKCNIPPGTPFVAIASGTVTFSGEQTGYGNCVEVTVNEMVDGKPVQWSYFYAHMSKRSVSEGQEVKEKDQIGVIGSTGNSTANHMHIEIRKMVKDQNGRCSYYGIRKKYYTLGMAFIFSKTDGNVYDYDGTYLGPYNNRSEDADNGGINYYRPFAASGKKST